MNSEDREAIDAVERRLSVLEAALRALAQQFDALRGVPSAPAAPAAPQRRAEAGGDSPIAVRPVMKRDWEGLVGRYGTLVLATVSALAAVGTFIGWAIANGWLGPTQRIALGLLTAAALAVGGLRLRRRERSFGASLLGLSLAVMHVCAWGAGPSLHLVPDWAAFAMASAASIALAIFARAEEDEPLWCVGFSGASIAPFVTASEEGSMPLLAAYGAAVMVSSGYAMGARAWRIAGRLFVGSAALYVGALALGAEREYGPLLAVAVPLFVGFSGVLPWSGGSARRERLRALGALTALAAIRAGLAIGLPLEKQTSAAFIAAAGIAWLAIVQLTYRVAPDTAPDASERRAEGDWLDAGLLPFAFVIGALAALDASTHANGLALIAAAGVLLATVVRFPSGSLRDAAVVATVICAVGAISQLEQGRPLAITGWVAVIGTVCFASNVWRSSASWTTLGLFALAWAMLSSVGALNQRLQFQYTPFLTRESALAAGILSMLLASWRFARPPQIERFLLGGSVVWAFAWVHQEIAFAVNPTVSTLLRVSYYAVTSVAAVGVGRARGVALLRHVGLGLAVIAAGTALYSARHLAAVGARISANLVAAVFLLAIAYWYRRPGNSSEVSEPAGPQSHLL